jgi:hypothetical protein
LNISQLIDEFVELKRQRTALAADDKILSGRQQVLEADIMQKMAEAGTFRAASEHGHTCNLTKKTHPAIVDWNEFYKFVAESGSFDLLQKRLSAPAFRDRWNEGQAIPGAGSSEVWDLSITTSRS